MSRLPLAAQFVVGMAFLLVGAFLCVLAGTGGEPAPLIAGGLASAAGGLTLLALGVVRRNRSGVS